MLTWTLGDVTIFSICESETATSPRFLFDGVSKLDVLARAVRAPWLRPHFVNDDGLLLQAIQCLVVQTPTQVIAVDTCVGNDKARNNPGWNQLQTSFLDRMTDAGFPPDRIDVVVCTHLHVDHVGWNTRLVNGEWQPTFPNARYLFVETEFEHWKITPDAGGDDYFGDSVAPIIAAGRADLVAADHVISAEIGTEIRLEPTHGHTPGHVSVAITSRDQRAVITGDMTHTPLQIADPDLSSMFDTDQAAARECRHVAFARWSSADTLVIGTHFANPTAGRLVRADDGGWIFAVAQPLVDH